MPGVALEFIAGNKGFDDLLFAWLAEQPICYRSIIFRRSAEQLLIGPVDVDGLFAPLRYPGRRGFRTGARCRSVIAVRLELIRSDQRLSQRMNWSKRFYDRLAPEASIATGRLPLSCTKSRLRAPASQRASFRQHPCGTKDSLSGRRLMFFCTCGRPGFRISSAEESFRRRSRANRSGLSAPSFRTLRSIDSRDTTCRQPPKS